MKKIYSAPIAEWIETEMDGTMQQHVSMAVTNPDTPAPGIGGEEIDPDFAEGKGYSKGCFSEIFDADF